MNLQGPQEAENFNSQATFSFSKRSLIHKIGYITVILVESNSAALTLMAHHYGSQKLMFSLNWQSTQGITLRHLGSTCNKQFGHFQ
jgi:hypothetical protein